MTVPKASPNATPKAGAPKPAPCPRCGAPAVEVVSLDDVYWVECSAVCTREYRGPAVEGSLWGAIEAWNGRRS